MTDTNVEPRFLEMVKLYYDRAAKLTGLDEDMLKMIKECDAVVRFNIPIRRDSGRIEMVTCYR